MKLWIALLLTLTVFSSALLPAARGDEEADQLMKKRARTLKVEAKRWWEKRKKLVGPCYHCKGKGVVTEIVAGQGRGGISRKTCPTCDGRKRWVYSKAWTYLYFDKMTPAFRNQRNASRDVKNAYDRANRGQYPERIRSYRIKDVDLLNLTHGTVLIHPKGADPVHQQWTWIASRERGGKGKWYLWDAKADGPWFQEPIAAPSEDEMDGKTEPQAPEGTKPPTAKQGPTVCSPETTKVVTSAVSAANHPWHVHRVLEDKTEHALIVELTPASTVDRSEFEAAVKASATSLTKALLSIKTPRNVLWIRWMDQFRNQYGEVEWRSHMTTVMTLDVFKRVVWDNLSNEESFDLLDAEPQKHRGWKLWRR